MHFDSDSNKAEKKSCSSRQQVPFFFMLLDLNLELMSDQL